MARPTQPPSPTDEGPSDEPPECRGPLNVPKVVATRWHGRLRERDLRSHGRYRGGLDRGPRGPTGGRTRSRPVVSRRLEDCSNDLGGKGGRTQTEDEAARESAEAKAS